VALHLDIFGFQHRYCCLRVVLNPDLFDHQLPHNDFGELVNVNDFYFPFVCLDDLLMAWASADDQEIGEPRKA